MRHILSGATALLAAMASISASGAPAHSYDEQVFAAAGAVEPKVVAWRRDFHQHPELSNQEVRTSKVVADHLRSLGLEVRTGIAKNGVIGILRGTKPGKTVVLRADMDALPVAEAAKLAFASSATAQFDGATVPVMHACGHDAHIAMLLGAADVLAVMKSQIAGTVLFVFQPAEEGVPAGDEGGAPLLIKQHVLDEFRPDAFFGIHVVPGEVGSLMWRSGSFMAGADTWEISVDGSQTHGAAPWLGVDAASVAADIVTSFNQIGARQTNVSHAPLVLSVGQIKLGARHNIIPGRFEVAGTLRTFDAKMREQVITKMKAELTSLEVKYGAHAELRLVSTLPVTANDGRLTTQMAPTLSRAAQGKVNGEADYVMASEDFAAYSAVAPTLFYHLGIGPSAPNHSPNFTIDESALEVGVRAHVLTALDFLNSPKS